MIDRRALILGGGALALTGCAAEPVWAPDDAVASAFYRAPGPTGIELITMRNVGSGNGAHSAIVITASQRVIFDPAGSFFHPSLPERNDVIFGITDPALAAYRSYHARETYYMVGQTLDLPPELAERALRYAMGYGAVPKANCTRATSNVLKQLPEIGSFRSTWFPDNLERQFARVPGVVRAEYRENDSGDLRIAREALADQVLAD